MAKYLSGRVKRDPQSALSADRYKYLDLKEAEPDLGDPLVGPSSVGAKPVPVGLNYIIVSTGTTAGERYWIPNQQGVIPGSISVFEEGALVGGLSSTTQLNFLGNAITATPGPGINTTPPSVNITVRPPGDNGSVLFKELDDFATSSKLVFNSFVGILTISNGGFNVGSGGTILTVKQSGLIGIGTSNPVRLGSDYSTSELHIRGDLKLSGTVWDSNNFSGKALDLLIRDDDIKPGFTTSGLRWVGQKEIRAGAGGTFRNVQYHNSAGLVDGAEFFAYDPNYGNVGIGSTLPKSTYRLDVLGDVNIAGLATITNLFVSGISTLGVTTTTDLTAKQLKVSGISTLGITTTTDLTAQSLVVSGVSTFQNNIIQTSGLVGIGTTNPLQKFQIGTANTLGVSTDGKVFVVTADAKVGIGTTNPTAKLDVRGDVLITGVSTFNSNIIQTSGLVGIGTTNPLQRFQIGTANTLGINSEGTVFVVTSNADVGIGTTNPKAKLHVQGDVLITGVSTVGLISGTSANFTGDITAANFAGNAAVNELYVVGVSTFKGKVNIQNDLGVTGLTTTKNLEVYESTKLKNLNATGIATIGTLGVLGLTTTSRLIVSGVATIGNIKLDQNTIFTTSSNLILDTTGGLVEIKDQLYVTDTSQSIDKDDGSIRTEGGIGVEKNLNVGEKLTVIGNVGIGTLTPLQKFQIGVANTLGHSIDGKVFVVTEDAKVGIGTTNPTAKLDVRGDVYIKDDLTVDGGDVKSNTTSLNLFNTNVTTANVLGDGTAIVIGATTGITTIRNATLDLDGDLNVDGGDVTSNAVSLNLFNTNVTTANVLGAGTTISIGATTGITTIRNNVSIGGTLTVTGNAINSSTATAITLSGANVTAKGTLTVDGNTTLKGTTTLGDAAGDTVSFVGNVGSGITPSAGNTHDLGSSGSSWRKIYGPLTGNADSATLIGVGTTTGNSLYYLTFVDFNNTTRTNEYLYTDDGISYNPSSDLLTVTNLKVSGISTLGITTVTDLTAQSLVVSGVSTFQNNIIQTSGLVGIGTTNPLQKFQIGTANTLGVSTDGKVFVVTADAKVGIGTTNPLAKLDVRGDVYIKDDLNVDGGDVTSNTTSLNLFNTTVTTANVLGAGTAIGIGSTTGTTTIRNAILDLDGDLNVDGGDVTSNNTSLNLFNSNVTTANVLGSGTAIVIGSSTGITTIKNSLTVEGNTTLGSDVNSDTVSFGATVSSNIIPSADATYNLGSTDNRWKNIFTEGEVKVGESLITKNLNVSGIATIGTLGVTGLTTTKNLVVFDTVGIGTTNPLQKFQIGTANTLGHSTDGKVFVVTSSADVGIGTTNPLAKLDVRGDAYIKDDLTVDGGDVKSANASLNLFNTNVITANVLGAGTVIGIGSTTGTTTIRNAILDLDGDLNVDGGDVTSNTASLNLFNTNVTTANVLGYGTNIVLGAATGTTTIKNATLDLDGDLNVDGGNVKSNTASLNLFNSNVTTANVLGSGTAIVIGSSTGITTIKNSLTVEGNTTLGSDINSDTVSFGATVSSHIIPSADATYNLGSTNNRWKNIFTEGTIKVDESLTTKNLNVTGIATIATLGVTGLTTTKNLVVFDTVGIGTDNPLQKLQIGVANTLGHSTDGKVFVVTSSADVGIGTTNPLAKLDVRGDISGITNIKASDNTTNITLTSSTLTAFAGNIKVGTDNIQASNGNTNITLTSNTLTAFAGNIKVSGNNIQSNTETAITLSDKNVTAKGDLTVDGNTTLKGNTTLGDAAGDIVSFGATVGTGITPSATNTHELGSENYKWKKVWAEAFSGPLIGNAATATQVGVGITTGTTSHYLTFVASNNAARTNEYLYSDDGISYNPSTNDLTISGIVTATQFSTGVSGTGININTNTISGPALLTIDPSTVGDNTGAVRIKGDLYVDGTQFIVNSTTIELADFNVGIATTVGTNADLDGAGIGIGSANIRKTLTYDATNIALKSSENFNLASGKKYMIDGVDIGTPTSFPTLTSIGILAQLQVTGISTFTNGPVLIGTGTSTGTALQRLQVTDGAYVSGKVGIGITNPTSKLHVFHSSPEVIITERHNANNSTIQYKNTSGSMYAGLITNATGWGIGSAAALDANSHFVVTKDTGKVGIGSATPTEKLDVNGNIVPSVTGTYNLGSTTKKWNEVHANKVNVVDGVLTSTDLETVNLNVTGIATIKTLGVTGLTTTKDLNVVGIATIGNVKISTNTVTTSSGNITIDSTDGTTTIDDILSVTGNATFNGNVTLGNDITTDTVTFTSKVNSNILPSANTHNLGSTDFRWGTVYATAFNGNITGTSDKSDLIKTVSSAAGLLYPTFVDTNNSSPGEYEALYTDAGISYNANDNSLTLTNLTVSGTSTFNGNVTLGNDISTDTVTFTSKVNSNILPSANTHNLGSNDFKWGTVYATAFSGPLTGGAGLVSIAAANQVLYKNSNNTEVVGSAGLIYDGNALNVGIGTTVSIGGDAGRNIELGVGATNIETYIDFYGSTHDDYSARITRQPGLDGNFIITNKGTGNINLATTVAFGATVSSSIIPSVTGTHNLGSNDLKWGTVFATAFSGPLTSTSINVSGISTIDVESTSPALRVTQRGTGDAILVEDSNPDSTPFVVKSDGSVGIGITNPTSKLHVFHSSPEVIITERHNANNSTIQYKNTSGSMYAGLITNATGWGIGSAAALDANSHFVVTKDTGDVGIGSATPTEKLDVNGNIVPSVTGTHNLGSNDRKWGTVYATAFNGTLTGGASLSSIAEANQVLYKNSTNTEVVGSAGLIYDGSTLKVGTALTTVSIGGDAGRNIELGFGATNIATYIDFYGSALVDFSARIIRDPGSNGNFTITNTGTGNINLATTVSFGGNVDSSIIPSSNTHNLGSNDKKWGTVYATAFKNSDGNPAIAGITIKEDANIVGNAGQINTIVFVGDDITATGSGSTATITLTTTAAAAAGATAGANAAEPFAQQAETYAGQAETYAGQAATSAGQAATSAGQAATAGGTAGTAAGAAVLNATGDANQVLYKNASNVATTSPNFTFNGTTAISVNGVNVGNGVTTGFYGDADNSAVRVPNGGGGFYVQSPSGAANWALFQSSGLTVYGTINATNFSGGGAFASGTTLLFYQAAAPTGWTKSTSHDNKALRVVSGTGGGSGGSAAFTTVFASRTPTGSASAHTLLVAEMPSHNHTNTLNLENPNGSGITQGTGPRAHGIISNGTTFLNPAGGDGSHSHGFAGNAMDFAVQYIDVIICSKD